MGRLFAGIKAYVYWVDKWLQFAGEIESSFLGINNFAIGEKLNT